MHRDNLVSLKTKFIFIGLLPHFFSRGFILTRTFLRNDHREDFASEENLSYGKIPEESAVR